MKIAWRNTLLNVLSAFVAFFVLLEATLNLGSYLYIRNHYKAQDNNYADAKNVKNILCLGDSLTFGIGTTSENCYPSQLKGLLENNATERINVINGARGSNTSSLLLKDLQKDIDTYSPDIIIIMIGSNNHWYLKGSSYFDLYKTKAGLLERMDYFLSNLKAYTLLKITWINLQYRASGHGQKITKNKILPESANICGVGTELFAQGKDDLAMVNFKKAASIDKNNYTAHLGMAHLFVTRNEYNLAKDAAWEAVYAFVRLLNAGGGNAEDFYFIINQVDRLYSKDDGIENRIELIKLKEYLQDNLDKRKRMDFIKIVEARLHGLRNEKIFDREVLEHDLLGVFNLTQGKKIKVVLQTYPNYPRRPIINATIRKISQKLNIPLVDNEKIFEGKAADVGSFFVSDGHCNVNGYRIIAENVYATLVSHNLVSGGTMISSTKDANI